MPKRPPSKPGPAIPERVWIGEYEVHPYKALVPQMPASMLEDLTAEIREAGKPSSDVMVDAEGRILDGRAQLQACLAAGVPPRIVQSPDADRPATAVLRSMRRTKYSGAQSSVTAARLLTPLSDEARERQRTRGRALPKKFGKGEAVEIAAKTVGNTNATYVRDAVGLLGGPPEIREIVDLIDAGLVRRMAQAKALAEMPDKQRITALRDIRKGKDVSLVIDRRKSVDDEWHTPAEICDAVRAAFGRRIACDPCAPKGGSHVDAEVSYTEAKDGTKNENPWFDFTFVNPPFSKAKVFVERAIRESTFQPESDETQAKRIYVLLPVRPDSEHQATLLQSAEDVLFLADRVPFEKPGKESSRTGKISVMIAGLNCSTHALIDHGLQGMVVRKSPRPFSIDPSEEDALRWYDEQRALEA